MPRGRLAFRENDLARAMRAAAKVGAPFHIRIEHATGDILVLPGDGPVAPGPIQAPKDDLDAELEAWRAKCAAVSEVPGAALRPRAGRRRA